MGSSTFVVLVQDVDYPANMYMLHVRADSRSAAAMAVELNESNSPFDFDIDAYRIVAVGLFLENDGIAMMRAAIRTTTYKFEDHVDYKYGEV